ncbi:MAG: isochorismate synthase [Chloroflexi bacterium]|nr:isochorismate synthase [Chloroflexota bacterium]
MTSESTLLRPAGLFDHLAQTLLSPLGRAPGSMAAAPLPAAVLELACAGGMPSLRRRATVSWEHADSGTAIFGLGAALDLSGPRDEGLPEAKRALSRVTMRAERGIAPDARPRFFGGAAFDPTATPRDAMWDALGGWRFVLPRVLVANTPAGWCGSVAVGDGDSNASDLADDIREALLGLRATGSRPRCSGRGGLAADPWKSAVATAVGEINAGAYEKVVLARQQTVALPPGVGSGAIATRLAGRFPTCFVFQLRTAESTWLGASPERLVSLQDGELRADSLASTTPRGATEEEDRALGEALLASPKEQAEHRFVVRALTESLRPACASLSVPAEPRLMKLPNIQHLHTPITGRAFPGLTTLDLVAAMHPTPAVGGWPRPEALEAIRRLESMDRGWYAAPIGWVDFDGNGEFAVGLRSALVTVENATLFAGAGIVGASDPERELAETMLKFRPLLGAIEGDR